MDISILKNTSDVISRQAAIDALNNIKIPRNASWYQYYCKALTAMNRLPSAQPENARERTDAFALPEIIVLNEYDTIESEDGRTGFGVYVPEEKKIYVAGDVPQEMKLKALFHELAHWVQDVSGIDFDEYTANELSEIIYDAVAPEETHDKRTETHACDCISRQAVLDDLDQLWDMDTVDGIKASTVLKQVKTDIKNLPSAQPEQHTCVNCGRTVNNGGWYADGGTRCPIEEHYALPKDGYCHLWEKRNVTDDNYPERRTDERTD